jgi:hypothetical protein
VGAAEIASVLILPAESRAYRRRLKQKPGAGFPAGMQPQLFQDELF